MKVTRAVETTGEMISESVVDEEEEDHPDEVRLGTCPAVTSSHQSNVDVAGRSECQCMRMFRQERFSTPWVQLMLEAASR